MTCKLENNEDINTIWGHVTFQRRQKAYIQRQGVGDTEYHLVSLEVEITGCKRSEWQE